MKANPLIHLQTEQYVADYQMLTPSLLHMKRILSYSLPFRKVDATGRNWNLCFADIPPGCLKLYNGEEHVAMSGYRGIFMPPFSVSDWQISTSHLEFHAYLSETPLPNFCPAYPILFTPTIRIEPKNEEEVLEILRTSKDWIPVDLDRFALPTARKARMKIVESYATGKSISAIAKELNVAHATITRAFRKSYVLSPVEYRNTMRIFDSWWLLLTRRTTISEVAFEVGFRDQTRFNKMFKRLSDVVPSQMKYN